MTVINNNLSIAFVHLFKCAGTGFIRVAQQNYKENNYEQKCRWDIDPNHPKAWESLGPEERVKLRFFCGHIVDGKTFNVIHRMVNKPYVLLTVLRDPIDRLVSSYYFIKQKKSKNHVLHSFANEVSFEEFLNRDVLYEKLSPRLRQSAFELLNNHQTRILSGTPHSLKWNFSGKTNPATSLDELEIKDLHYELAVRNLTSYFSFVGLQEELDSSWGLLNSRLGWKNVDPVLLQPKQRSNQTEGRPTVDKISNISRGLIEKENFFDIDLYNHIKQVRNKINTRPLVIINENFCGPTSF